MLSIHDIAINAHVTFEDIEVREIQGDEVIYNGVEIETPEGYTLLIHNVGEETPTGRFRHTGYIWSILDDGITNDQGGLETESEAADFISEKVGA